MTNTKFKKQRDLLLKEKERLEAELAQMQSEATVSEERREGSPFGKREEEATETLELEKRLGLENRMRQEIAAIDHTLDKIVKGTYGICDNCGKAIAEERLEALPQANLCIECKAMLAKNGKPAPQR
jgi:DnaK suppressor protein